MPLPHDDQAGTYRELVDLLARGETRRGRSAASFFGARATAASYQEVRGRLDKLRVSLRARDDLDPALASLFGFAGESTVALESLSPETTLIEYYWLGDRFVAFLSRQGSVVAVGLDVGRVELQRDVRRFLRSDCDDAVLARTLYSDLLAPLRSRRDGAHGIDGRIIIVPYGILHHLPFETLREGDPASGEAAGSGWRPPRSGRPV